MEARAAEPRLFGPADDSRVCAILARAAEKVLNIPDHLLQAVGVVESGRYVRALGRTEPWPWTINAAGKGATFPSKADAIAEVKRLRREGVSSIDVGCMQVNLAYHGDAFESLEEAFDPVMNVAYAAHFLTSLKQERGSWNAAVAAYHSSTPERGVPYRHKVAQTWNGIRGAVTQDAIKLRRAAIAEAYEKRRAEFTEHQARIVKIQQERREARQRQREALATRGVVELRGGTPPADSAPRLVEERDDAPATFEDGGVAAPKRAKADVVGALDDGGRGAGDGSREAPPDRTAANCLDTNMRDAAGGGRFDPKLAQQILAISTVRDALPSLAADGFLPERSELFDDTERWRDGAATLVRAGTGLDLQDPGPLSLVDIPELPVVRTDTEAVAPKHGCPRLIEQKPNRGRVPAMTPSVVRG